MKKDSYQFPAIFYYEPDGISIEFPDLPGCLPCAHTTEEAFAHAKEALGLHLWSMEKDGDVIPEPTPAQQLQLEKGAVACMIDVYMPLVRDRLNKRPVKKTLTIPAWLNAQAEAEHVNFSQVLQEALTERLGVSA